MPRIKTTRTVAVALVVLRIYLIVMLGLILVKFVTSRFSDDTPRPAAAPPVVEQPAHH
jgi:hypothetical protein